MLYFLIYDIVDVVVDLCVYGIVFEISWLDLFIEFCFLCIGIVVFDGIEIELCGVIELWYIFGEEVIVVGIVCYVDLLVECI